MQFSLPQLFRVADNRLMIGGRRRQSPWGEFSIVSGDAAGKTEEVSPPKVMLEVPVESVPRYFQGIIPSFPCDHVSPSLTGQFPGSR